MGSNDIIIYGFIGLVVLIVIFLLFRELNCWYWKINEKIALQKETNSLLGKISRQLDTNDKTSKQMTDKAFNLPINPISQKNKDKKTSTGNEDIEYV